MTAKDAATLMLLKGAALSLGALGVMLIESALWPLSFAVLFVGAVGIGAAVRDFRSAETNEAGECRDNIRSVK